MSDVEDLLKLQKLLDSGAITRQEYEREKAWILGTAGDSLDAASQQKALPTAPPAPDAFPEGSTLETRPERKRAKRPSGNRGTVLCTAEEPQPHFDIPQTPPAGSQRPQAGESIWLKVLVAVLSVFVTWPAAFVLILVKKPYRHRMVNVILALWDGIATVVLIAFIAYTAAISSISGASGSQTADAANTELSGAAESASSYDAFVDALKSTLQSSYGDHYTVEDDGKTLTVSIWQDGVAKEAEYVINGSQDSSNAWDGLKESLQSLSMTCFQKANSESPERHVVLNVLNDQNTNNVLLSYLDGTCVYDVVQQAKSAAGGSTAAATEN